MGDHVPDRCGSTSQSMASHNGINTTKRIVTGQWPKLKKGNEQMDTTSAAQNESKEINFELYLDLE